MGSNRSAQQRRALWAGRVLAVVPGLILSVQAATGALGANPIEALLNKLGWWALVLLTASLACTPLRLVFGWTWLSRWRRTLGLGAFWYATLHLGTYVGLDKFFAWDEIGDDLTKRPFITVGFAAFLLLLLLALTSPARMVKRLGGARWRAIHRLAYVAAALGLVHFFWRVKADLREPIVFASILVTSLAVRIGSRLRARRNHRAGQGPRNEAPEEQPAQPSSRQAGRSMPSS